MKIEKYSLINMMKEYNKNKHIVDAYIQGKSIENYSDSEDQANKTILGLSIGTFASVLIINIAIFIGALVLLIKRWNDPSLDNGYKYMSLFFLLIGLPLFCLFTLLIAK